MLDIFHMAYCPHYDEEGRDSFDIMLLQKNMIGLAMENNTVFVYDNGNQYFIRSIFTANAFLMKYEDGLFEKKEAAFEVI